MAFVTRSSCPLCDSDRREVLASLPFDGPELRGFLERYFDGRVEHEALRGGSYAIARCMACGGMWQKEILDAGGMERLYGHWIDPKKSAERRQDATRTLQTARHCARLLRLFPHPGQTRLLDYGMGWGEWCLMAKAFGFAVAGVELSQERVMAARAKGIDAFLPDDLPPGPYDFLYLEQVLEHLPDPRKTMRELTTLVRPGGYIHVGVPNGKTVSQLATRNPQLLLCKGPAQPLEHINIFTPVTLRSFMKSFACVPASQREGLIRVSPLPMLCADFVLAIARFLPSSIFPPGTSVLFRKTP